VPGPGSKRAAALATTKLEATTVRDNSAELRY
jgi:hypothetical protein